MRISVAMAAYNSAAFLDEHLRSIAQQTRLPDQMIISDDGSTDTTMVIVERFAANAPFPVQILHHPQRSGYAQNFGYALSHCDGDLVLLSDDDDWWHEHKIARLEEAAKAHPDSLLIMHDAEYVDEGLQPLGMTEIGRQSRFGYDPLKSHPGLRRPFQDVTGRNDGAESPTVFPVSDLSNNCK